MPKVSDLFEVAYGHSLELNRLSKTKPGHGIAFVSRQEGSNGISAWVAELESVPPAPAGELTCALNGNGVLTTHLQEQPYYTAFHVARLVPRTTLSKPRLLFYAMCIKANAYRYSYGRQANRSLKDLELPSLQELPAYVDTADVDRFSGRAASISQEPPPRLDMNRWREFKLGRHLFTIRKGKRLTKAEMVPGSVPFISALDWNNGLRQRIAGKPGHPAGVLTVNYNGNGVAEAFYQPEEFLASDDVNILYPRFSMDVAVALFVCAVIRQEKYRFSYGRKWNLERMKESIVRLPATANGRPDCGFMRSYICTLQFSATACAALDSAGLDTMLIPLGVCDQNVKGPVETNPPDGPSHSSIVRTTSTTSQSRSVTPAAIAGVARSDA